VLNTHVSESPILALPPQMQAKLSEAMTQTCRAAL